MDQKKDIAVIIPVFNAETCIRDLVKEVYETLLASGKSFEVILVDDRSKDKSWDIIRELGQEYEFVSGYLLGRNYGQHKATQCGLANSHAEWAVTMDDDFEHPPSQIIPLIEKAKASGADIFYGVSANSEKSIMRTLASRLFKFLSKMENADAGKGSSFRVVKGDIARNLEKHESHLFFLDEMLLWYTDHVATEEIVFNKSRKAASGYNYNKLLFLSLDVWMISTTMPLKLVKFLGFSVSTLSFIFGIYSLIHKLLFKTAKGYTSLILTITFSTGLILLCIGIIGEYISNILISQNKKPGYNVREKI